MSTALSSGGRGEARRGLRRVSPALACSALVVLVTLAANAAYLLRIRSNNPILYYSGLGSYQGGWVKGAFTIDPNVGWTAQALGHRAAQDWVHGHVPLWNLYEGVGQPLAGEMQSAAFFLPFVLLQLLPNGIFMMHVALEIVAGLATLGLLRTLRLSWVASSVGACLFALNGAFSVMTNAPFNPIAFLPMALLGVELTVRAIREQRRPRVGILVTALAVAWMLYSGFPETAFLEGIFVACWVVVRLVGSPGRRRAVAAWSITGAGLGILLAAPILLAFKDFLNFGTTAYHEDIANAVSYPARQITSLALPYAAGPLVNPVIGFQAGYVTLPAVLMAVVGLFSRRERALRVLLGLSVVVLVANMFDFAPVKVVLNHVPGIASVLTYKYGLVLIEFAVVVLAAFALDDLGRAQVRPKGVLVAGAFTALYFVGSAWFVIDHGYVNSKRWTLVVLTVVAVFCVTLCILLLRAGHTRVMRGAGGAAAVAALVLILDAGAHHAVPQLSASPRRAVDMKPVEFLQKNLGTSRFYTLGPIQPNYGSYWGIQQFNANDLPISKKYSDHLVQDLTPKPGTPGARGTDRSFETFQLVPFNPKPKEQRALLAAYGQSQEHFRAAGVKYVVMAPGVGDGAKAQSYGLRKVFTSRKAEIWQDARSAPYYSTSRDSCSVTEQSLTGVKLDCSAPATLTRLQLSSPGWTATVNGKATTVADPDAALYQSITVPQGASTVSYAYEPKHFKLAVGVSLLLALGLAGDVLFGVLTTRRRRPDSTQAKASAHG